MTWAERTAASKGRTKIEERINRMTLIRGTVRAVNSVRHGPLGEIDNEDIDGTASRHQLQPELFFDGGEDRRRRGVGRAVGGPCEREVDRPSNAGFIDNGTLNPIR